MVQETIDGFFERVLWGNSVQDYFIALGIFALVFLVLFGILRFVVYRFQRHARLTKFNFDDYIADTLSDTKWWFLLVVSLYAACQYLKLSDSLKKDSQLFAVTVFLIQIGLWGKVLIESFTKKYEEKNMEVDATRVTSLAILSFLGRLVLYSIILLLIFENAGINVTGLIAGLGVGGVAIALASQGILGDIFASLTIALDKPFAIGDFIISDSYLGTIENIGVKTTRLRSLGGEQILIPNANLVNSRIRNYKKMEERRVLFGFGVTYQTRAEQLQKIPDIVREIISGEERTRFDRAHFKEYGDSSLNFEVVFYVLSPDYNVYMDIQQAILLKLFIRFIKEGIDFAYPTRTLYLQSN